MKLCLNSVNYQFQLSEEGAFIVDKNMKTSIDDIYAAGDCCAAGWDQAENWFQV